MKHQLRLVTFVTFLFSTLVCGTAFAATMFSVPMTGAQEVPSVSTANSGTALFELSADQTELTYDVTVMNFDFGGAFTVDTSDDITGLHIHNAPASSNGGVKLGIYNPSQDPDRTITVGPGPTIRFQGIWDAADPSNDSLASQLANLLSGELYINLHTIAHPGGELRGQLSVPEPSTAALAMVMVCGLTLARRRR